MNELILTNELDGLEQSKADQIKAVFDPMIVMLKSFEKKYDEVMEKEITLENCEEAKELRLKIAKIRIDSEKLKNEQKKQYLIGGNAIQAVFNLLKFAVAEKEDNLKAREKHFENIEIERVEKLNSERLLEVQKYNPLIEYNDTLGAMPIEIWEKYIAGEKYAYKLKREDEVRQEQELIEQELKQKTFDQRLKTLLPYKFFNQYSLSIDTTEEDYKKLWDRCYLDDEEEKERQLKIEEENKILRENQLKIEEENRLLKIKQDEEVKISDSGIIIEISDHDRIERLLEHMETTSEQFQNKHNKEVVLNARMQILRLYKK